MHLKKDNAWRAKRRWRGENIYIKNTAVTHRHVMLRQKYVACPALAIDTTEGVKKTPQCQCQQYIFGIGVCLLGPLHGGLWLVSSSEGGWFKVSRLLSSLWWIWFLCGYPADPAVMPETKITAGAQPGGDGVPKMAWTCTDRWMRKKPNQNWRTFSMFKPMEGKTSTCKNKKYIAPGEGRS